ncbi:acyl-protein thioesterase [Perkinsus chesapeaki]|uniref:Acyl-protein thioesterase n=1 Tax=Perkinsus chesapeaki TaxID=330153 RepID=A0A7J6M1H9_PERCH|nr:acyl-protein thioesterase [Perkinsus chesapeaki]
MSKLRTPRRKKVGENGDGIGDPLVVLWRLAYALKSLSKEAALDIKLSEAARLVMSSSEMKTSGPLLLGLSRLHMLKVEVVENMAQGLIHRMLKDPTATGTAWHGGGGGRMAKGGAPLPAISEEADGWSDAETIDALIENSCMLSPTLKTMIQHLTPSRGIPSPFSSAGTPLEGFMAASLGSSVRQNKRSTEQLLRSGSVSGKGGGEIEDSYMHIDELRELSQPRASSAFSFDGEFSPSSKNGRRSSQTDRDHSVFDRTPGGVQDSLMASIMESPADDGWEFTGVAPAVPAPTTRQVVARAASRRRARRATVGRNDRNKGADISGISLVPNPRKRTIHRKRHGGMPDLTPDDVLGFIHSRLRSVEEMQDVQEDVRIVPAIPLGAQGHSPVARSEASFLPPFTPARSGVEEVQDEQDLIPAGVFDDIHSVGMRTPFTEIDEVFDAPWTPGGRTPSRAASPFSTASSKIYDRRTALQSALEVLWKKEGEPVPTFQGLVRDHPVKAFMEGTSFCYENNLITSLRLKRATTLLKPAKSSKPDKTNELLEALSHSASTSARGGAYKG